MAVLAPVPRPSRTRSASAELRLDATRGHPPVSGRATACPGGDAGTLALDWTLRRRLFDAR